MQHSNHVIASGLLGPAAHQGYTEGAIDFLNVISVQAALLQSQSQVVNVDTEIQQRMPSVEPVALSARTFVLSPTEASQASSSNP